MRKELPQVACAKCRKEMLHHFVCQDVTINGKQVCACVHTIIQHNGITIGDKLQAIKNRQV